MLCLEGVLCHHRALLVSPNDKYVLALKILRDRASGSRLTIIHTHVREEVKLIDGKCQARRIMPLSLTFDHRAATGGEASRFLAAMIEDLRKAV